MNKLYIEPEDDGSDGDAGNGNPPPKDPPKTGGRSAPVEQDGKK